MEKPTTAKDSALKQLRESFANCFSRSGYYWGWLLPWSVTPRCSVSFSLIRLGDCKTLAHSRRLRSVVRCSSKKEEKGEKRQGGNHDAEAHGGKNYHREKWGSVGN
jgi:hypothetical protein